MIFNDLKAQFGASAAVIREFVTLMAATFTQYRDIQAHLFNSLPAHLQKPGLTSLIEDDIRARLFDGSFCDSIPQALKSLRRAIIRLEDLHEQHQQIPGHVNNLEILGAIAERVEALYQQHWEYYRYQSEVGGAEILQFLLEVDRIGKSWDAYLAAFQDKVAMMQALEGRPAPEDRASLRIGYQRHGAAHFSVGTLRALVNFLESGYRFICAVFELDPEEQPLSLLHVEIAEPVVLYLSLPPEAETAYRKLLQYLFLKDMLKRESLLKFVFQAVEKEHDRTKTLSTTEITAFLKDLGAQVKALPADGRFFISDRAFPDDEISVLQEFVVMLEGQETAYDALIGATKPKASRRRKPKADPTVESTVVESTGEEGAPERPAAAATAVTGAEAEVPAAPVAPQPRSVPPTGDQERQRRHIRILTDSPLQT